MDVTKNDRQDDRMISRWQSEVVMPENNENQNEQRVTRSVQDYCCEEDVLLGCQRWYFYPYMYIIYLYVDGILNRKYHCDCHV